ncbi:hypothetical protein [Streptomyces sp. NWU339]|uniref:hypothetical protein n=1 Tax=Streptomyces sp. NWU339 TaxID=2185284 RepID=UPI00215B04D9|nr:hypothetical protein [Streptomyces sp. NWU339]
MSRAGDWRGGRCSVSSPALPEIDRWVRRSGTRLLFVNGTQDPATAEPFPPGRHDSRVLWVPGANHHTTIADLPTPDRTEATTMLTRWAGTRPTRSSCE